jgi:hypothetical protein
MVKGAPAYDGSPEPVPVVQSGASVPIDVQQIISRAVGATGWSEPIALMGRAKRMAGYPSTQPAMTLRMAGMMLVMATLLITAVKFAPTGHPVESELPFLGAAIVPAVIGAALWGAGSTEFTRVKSAQLSLNELRDQVHNGREALLNLSQPWFTNTNGALGYLERAYGIDFGNDVQDRLSGVLAELNYSKNMTDKGDLELLAAVQRGLISQWASAQPRIPETPTPTKTMVLVGGGLMITLATLATIAAQLIALGVNKTALAQLTGRDAAFLYGGMAAGGLVGAALFGAGLAQLRSGQVKELNEMSREQLEQELQFLQHRATQLWREMALTTQGAEQLLRIARPNLPKETAAQLLTALNELLKDPKLDPSERALAESVQVGLALQVGIRMAELVQHLGKNGTVTPTEVAEAASDNDPFAQELLELRELLHQAKPKLAQQLIILTSGAQ